MEQIKAIMVDMTKGWRLSIILTFLRDSLHGGLRRIGFGLSVGLNLWVLTSGMTSVQLDIYREVVPLKINARNMLMGTVKQVDSDSIAARVVVQVDSPAQMAALTTKDAVDDLEIKGSTLWL